VLGFVSAVRASDTDDTEDEAAAEDAATERKVEFTVVPFLGGTSDLGFGGGYVAAFAVLDSRHHPYLYRLESAGGVTFAAGHDAASRVPYAEDYLLFRSPELFDERLGFEARLSYTREATLGYYGLGNAARIPSGADTSTSLYEHARVHPTLRATWDYRLKPVVLTWGVGYTQNLLDVPSDSQLARDMSGPNVYWRRLLGNARPHGAPMILASVGWDSRDDEMSPVRGLYITQQIEVTPATVGAASYSFARSDSIVRAYIPLIARDRRLVLALRALGDLLFGKPPFYELPRLDDTFAIGGANGVRGVTAQRYNCKIKAIANVELRSELLAVSILGAPRRFGFTAFADTGRLWTDYRSNPDLDGTSLGLKYGVGGGLRIASGSSFVLRLDVAWSPDARPISGYLIAGHMF
jgi:outer membrane protein assembly factor BamA